jgi:hypothetical protein
MSTAEKPTQASLLRLAFPTRGADKRRFCIQAGCGKIYKADTGDGSLLYHLKTKHNEYAREMGVIKIVSTSSSSSVPSSSFPTAPLPAVTHIVFSQLPPSSASSFFLLASQRFSPPLSSHIASTLHLPHPTLSTPQSPLLRCSRLSRPTQTAELTVCALALLSLTTSEAAGERTFSKQGIVHSKLRNALSAEFVQAQMFVAFNYTQLNRSDEEMNPRRL